MSRSELHDWECAIESLSGDNADKMLAIAQDIYNTAFVRGKNHVSLVTPSYNSIKTELKPCEDCISREAAIDVVRKWFDKMQLNGDICLDGIISLPSVTSTIPDVENNFNLGYNCGYADAMNDIAESEVQYE